VTPAWTESFRLRRALFPETGLADVVVHAPAGFDASRPLHVVFFAHSVDTYALQWVGTGPVRPGRGAGVMEAWGLDTRHDLAGTNTLLVAPQFDNKRRRDWTGPFSRRAFLRAFLDELFSEVLVTKLGRRLSSQDVVSLTVAGSSIGGYVTETLVAHSDMADRIRTVILYDAFYGGAETYARWLLRAPPEVPRRLVVIHGGTADMNESIARLMARIRAKLADEILVNPTVPVAEAVRARRVVLAVTPAQHVGMALLYHPKVLAGLDLPPVTGVEAPDQPRTRATALPARANEDIAAALTGDDARLNNGCAYDDYTVTLDAGSEVTIRARGGGRHPRYRVVLDTRVQVLDAGRVVADDDDSGERLSARVRFTPIHTGTFIVRVSACGAPLWTAPYTLRVETTSNTRG
jgi:hypothetical protein